MSEKADPSMLADLATFKVDGPTIVFIRPRRGLSQDEMLSVMQGLKELKLERVRFVLVPSHFDIMAVGDAELERYGLARLPGVGATEDKPA